MVKKIILGVIILTVIICLGYWVYRTYPISQSPAETFEPITFDPMNATYVIDGEVVVLTNGQEEKEVVPGSAAQSITIVWNQVAKADLNNDGTEDAALILMNNVGGSGTFFYVVVALSDETNKAMGTNAIFIGDRIFMENISISNGLIIVDYLDRAESEPMVAEPTINISRSFIIEAGVLKELGITN